MNLRSKYNDATIVTGNWNRVAGRFVPVNGRGRSYDEEDWEEVAEPVWEPVPFSMTEEKTRQGKTYHITGCVWGTRSWSVSDEERLMLVDGKLQLERMTG